MLTVDNKLKLDYEFTDKEHDYISNLFLNIRSNPYKEYLSFCEEIDELIQSDQVLAGALNTLKQLNDRDWIEKPFLYLKNCPHDKDVPYFDHEDAVNSKYKLKKSYIAEAFLQFYATATGNPAIGYINVNNGDIFQDIYPIASLAKTQSQKAMVALGFHKDLANHFVRPDFVNMLSMRSFDGNEIYTTFVRNVDILKHMTPSEINLMKEEIFHTPFDDLSTHGNRTQLGRAKNHAILLNEIDIAYFENRTVGLNTEAQQIVDKIKEVLHKVKMPLLMKPGEFISVSNNHSLHGKDIGTISDVEQQKVRWIIKTVNVYDLNTHSQYFMEGSNCIVNG